MQETTVGDVPVRALRVTYVGELGWELYCPTEYGAGLWRALVDAGEPPGCARPATGRSRACGWRRATGCGARTSPGTRRRTRPGLAFAVRPGDGYAGAVALAATRAQGPARGTARRLRCLVLDDPRAVALGGEPVRADGAAAALGYVTSGGYGYTVGRSIAYALLPAAIGVGTAVQVQVDGERVDAEVVRGPLYDPKGDRIRA